MQVVLDPVCAVTSCARRLSRWVLHGLDDSLAFKELNNVDTTEISCADSSSSESTSDESTKSAESGHKIKRGQCWLGRSLLVLLMLNIGCGWQWSKTVSLQELNQVMSEASSAREKAEELAARGEKNEAVQLLESMSLRWSSIERYARTVIMRGSSDGTTLQPEHEDPSPPWAAVFEETQQEMSRLRSVLGSFLLENGHYKKAKKLLAPTCPTLWFFSRRAALGDDAVRGEVGWLRCYADLVASHKALDEEHFAHILERDVVAHSTTWLRKRRDTKPNKPSSIARPRLGRRRQHELESRWPLRPPRLRAPRKSHHAPKSMSRLDRNEKIVRTLFFLSKLSILSPSERAVTSRDCGRAQTRSKQTRRELEALAEAMAEAPDTIHRTKVLTALREVKDRLFAELAFESARDTESESTTRWNAGVALAAMLRASSHHDSTEEDANEKNETAVNAMLESLSEHVTAPAKVEKKTPSTETIARPFGPAFARHVLAEASEYLDVATQVHSHGWGWLQREAARLEEEQRRSGLAIAPASGPPPGFASRYDIVHLLGALKTSAVKRAERYSAQQQFYQQQQQQKRRNPARSKTQKKKQGTKNSIQDELATFLNQARPSPAVVTLLIVAASALRGTYILREQQRRESDGYAKRRPKRTTRQYFTDLIAYLGLAIGVCFLSTWTKVHRALVPTVTEDARAVKRALYALYMRLRSRSLPNNRQASSTRSVSSSNAPSVQRRAGSHKRAIPGHTTKRRGQLSSSNEEQRDAAVQSQDTEKTDTEQVLVHASDAETKQIPAEEISEEALLQNDEWRPVPKGGRVKGDCGRVVAAAAKPAPVANLREQLATAGNAGTSALSAVEKVGSDLPADGVSRTRNDRSREERQVPGRPSTPPQKKNSATVSNSSNSSVDGEGEVVEQRVPTLKSRKKSMHKVTAILKRESRPDGMTENRTPPPPQQQESVIKVSPTQQQHKSPNKKKSQSMRTAKAKAPRLLAAPRMPRPGDEGTPSTHWQGSQRYYYPPQAPSAENEDPYIGSPRAGGTSPRLNNFNRNRGSQESQQQRVVTPPHQLYDAIRLQVEYYFSVSNLAKDIYLRTNCMDEDGYVSLAYIASFKRVFALTNDLNIIWEALLDSSKLELWEDPDNIANCKVRTNDQPERWSPKFFQVTSSSED